MRFKESFQTSVMQLFFLRIANGYQLLGIFAKNLHHRHLTGL